MMFGYENLVWKENHRITLAKPEKIIIDALYLRAIPSEELEDVINSVDKELLLTYAKLTGNSGIINTIKELIKR